jgi:flagellar hook-basal body complex protein FliE
VKILSASSGVSNIVSGVGRTEKVLSQSNFHSIFTGMLQEVNESQQVADDLAVKFIAGAVEDIHQVAFAMERAQLNLQLAVQVRNKIVEAYQEIMRMQV